MALYEGDPLRLTVAGSSFDTVREVTLGPLAADVTPVHVVLAGEWQAAQSLGDYTLVGCTVGPGFEFADFSMLSDDGEAAEGFLLKYPSSRGARVAVASELMVLRDRLRAFAAERDWDQFHSPKNLSAALSVEASELLEHFQWLKEDESFTLSPEKRAKVAEEIADVLLYLVRIADKLDIDVLDAALKKIEANGKKYPVDKSRGSMRKYTEL